MDLSRGVCVLCTNNTKIVVPPQAENITNLLCKILNNYVDVKKFDETKSSLKVCPSCLYDIELVAEHQKEINKFSENSSSCSLCHSNKHLVSIIEWGHFDALLENINAHRRRRCIVCLHCIKFLEIFQRIKGNFINKYPRLQLTTSGKEKKSNGKVKNNHKSPNIYQTSDSESKNDSRTNKRPSKNFKKALAHLQPLKYSRFNLDQVRDVKLLKQVAFVKLDVSDRVTKAELSPTSRKSDKHRIISQNDRGSSRESSPKQSFFKIRLKLNANRTKAHKVLSGKVTKPQPKSKTKIEPKTKELIVKILKMDLKKIKQRPVDSDSDEDEPMLKTPTKASRKMMPEDPLSSSKKRKNVTFAADLNTEIVDGANCKKDSSDVTPLRSSLKKGSSPTADLFANGSSGNSSEEESEVVSNIIKKIGKDNEESDDDFGVSKSYVKEIQKNNDSIFDNLKSDKPVKKTKPEKKRKYDSGSESEGSDVVGSPKSRKIRKKSKGFNNATDSEDSSSDSSSNKPCKKNRRESKDKKDSKSVQEEDIHIDNGHKSDGDERKSSDTETVLEKTNSINKKDGKDKSEGKVDETKDQTCENGNEESTESNKEVPGNKAESQSFISESSNEDKWVTLNEYKKSKNREGEERSEDSSSIGNIGSSEDPWDGSDALSLDQVSEKSDIASIDKTSENTEESKERRKSITDKPEEEKNEVSTEIDKDTIESEISVGKEALAIENIPIDDNDMVKEKQILDNVSEGNESNFNEKESRDKTLSDCNDDLKNNDSLVNNKEDICAKSDSTVKSGDSFQNCSNNSQNSFSTAIEGDIDTLETDKLDGH